MTDTAPPARTALTAEEWAERYRRGYDSIDEVLAAAITLARSEGRLAGLEEAAGEVRRIEEEVEDGEDVVNLCDELERRIRGLADRPKAP